MNEITFNTELAKDVAEAFSRANGLGAVVYAKGFDAPIYQVGYTCANSDLCKYLGRREQCARIHDGGLEEADRFGGKYIYDCPRGLTFFVSPIIGERGVEARITVGPFRMIDIEDFIATDLQAADNRHTDGELYRYLAERIPYVEPGRVEALSRLLFLSVGYVNGVASVNAQRNREQAVAIQGQLNAYIMEIKLHAESGMPYPLDKERKLLTQIRRMNRSEANRTLNELLGYILLTSGDSLEWMRARINELMVLISRACMDSGYDAASIQHMMNQYYMQLTMVKSFEELCACLSGAMHELMDKSFALSRGNHVSQIRAAIGYIRTNLRGRVTLDAVAREVGLSPEYLSRVFHKETGTTFQQFVTDERLNRAAEMMRYEKLSIGDIAGLVGFEEQSYFARVFKRKYGVSPAAYRKQHSR